MKKLIAILLFLFLSTKSYASYSSSLSLFGSNDSDKTNIIISTLYLTYSPESKYYDSFSLSHSDIRINGKNFNFNGYREAALLDFKSINKKSILNLDVGVTTINDNSTVTGNINFGKILNEKNTIILYAENNIVDNEKSIEENLYYTLLSANFDHEGEKNFLSGVIGSAFFSNDNRRDFIKTKIGYSVWKEHGVYAYVRTYNYKNSSPYQGFYFDPENYGRYLVGLQTRDRFSGGILTARIDVGTQIFDGNSEISYSWYADYKKNIIDPLVLHIKLESNQFEPKYRFTSLFLNIKYYFSL